MELILIVAVACLSCVLLSSWQASLLIGLVLLTRSLLGSLLPARARYLLWSVVLARLVVPVFPQSDLSIFNLASDIPVVEALQSSSDEITAFELTGSTETEPSTNESQRMALIAVRSIRAGDEVRAGRDTDVSADESEPAPIQSPVGSAADLIAAASEETDRRPILALIWFVGAVFFAVRLLFAHRRLSGILASATEISDAAVIELFEHCRRSVGITGRVTLLSVGNDMTPAVTGLRHPRILIPQCVLDSFDKRELKFVLLHELIHIRRNDVAVNWLTSLVQIVHWFNPVVWFAMRRQRFDRELACDALVLSHAGESEAANYGHTAIKLLGLFNSPRPIPAAVGILDRKRSVVRRIAMIGQYRKPTRMQWMLAVVVLSALAGIGLTDAVSSEAGNEETNLVQTEESEVGHDQHVAAGSNDGSAADKTAELTSASNDDIRFVDVTEESGLAVFVHEGGSKPNELSERLGSGCAFIDFDGDGDQDIILVNVRRASDQAKDKSANAGSIRLLENDGQGRFRDVTPKGPLWSGVAARGVAVGDFDNDGRSDVYVSSIGLNRLYRNLGNGEFEDITAKAGVSGAADVWSTGSGWIDIDNDGDLDLFVASYARFDRDGKWHESHPSLFRNDGDGRFTDLTDQSGLNVCKGQSLGVTFIDFDEDGLLDIFLANDGAPNALFRNRDGQTFEDIGLRAGCSVAADGRVTGSTGIDIGLLENGSLGIAVGNGVAEGLGLYIGRNGLFQERSGAKDIAAATLPSAAFGVGWLDVNSDGRLDLFVANGHTPATQTGSTSVPDVILSISDAERPTHIDLKIERKESVVTDDGGVGEALNAPTFAEKSDRPLNARGAAFADIDGDGDVDVLMSAIGQSPRLLRNESSRGRHWLRLKLIGKRTNRDAIGSRVTIESESGRRQQRQVMPTRGYLSQSELVVTFGLDREKIVPEVTIEWADGSRSTIENVAADQTLVVEQREVFEPQKGVVVDLNVRPGQSVRKGDVLIAAEEGDAVADAAVSDAAGGDAAPADDDSEAESSVRVELRANSNGALSSLRFAGTDLGKGDEAFEQLATRIRKWATAEKSPKLEDREVEIRSDRNLKYEFVARAVSVCSGRMNPDTGNIERYVGRIKFALPRHADELEVSIGFVRAKDGKRLSSTPIVLWEDRVVLLDQVRKQMEIWLASRSGSAKRITLSLRVDADVDTKTVQKLIRLGQDFGFDRFSLKTVEPDAVDAGGHTRRTCVIQLNRLEAKRMAEFLGKVFEEKATGTLVVAEPETNRLIISTSGEDVLETINRILEQLDGRIGQGKGKPRAEDDLFTDP